jgi:hypothetical protein
VYFDDTEIFTTFVSSKKKKLTDQATFSNVASLFFINYSKKKLKFTADKLLAWFGKARAI